MVSQLPIVSTNRADNSLAVRAERGGNRPFPTIKISKSYAQAEQQAVPSVGRVDVISRRDSRARSSRSASLRAIDAYNQHAGSGGDQPEWTALLGVDRYV